eukprot:jgi/Chlat1/3463/Chrsp23S08827
MSFKSWEAALGAPPKEFTKVLQLPKRLGKLAFARRQLAEQLEHNKLVSKTEMKKQLAWYSYSAMGIGIIMATGIFSFMPYIYAYITGPAVVLALIIASGVAALSALVYSEFAVDYPVVGGGFVYVLNVFGELPAVLCATGLVIDYVFGTSATLRNFSVYFAQLTTVNVDILQRPVGFQNDALDWLALAVALFLTLVGMYSMKIFDESNIGLDPHGARTIVTGASNIFFVFIGYDVIALGAEEAKNDWAVPIGMITSVLGVSVIYCLMSVSLVMLIPYDVLAAQPENIALSGFAYGFTYRGLCACHLTHQSAESPDAHGDRHLALKFRPDPFRRIGTRNKRILLLVYLALITLAPVGFTIFWNLESDKSWGLILCVGAWAIFTLMLQLTMPMEYIPKKFRVPDWLMPWAPSASIFANIMLIGGFGANKADYYRLFVALGIGLAIYLLFGVHASYYRFYGPKGTTVNKLTAPVYDKADSFETKGMDDDARPTTAA